MGTLVTPLGFPGKPHYLRGMDPSHLIDRAVIGLSGPEARDFLQNLVSNDVENLTPGDGLYATLLSPQGKIGFDFLLVEGDGAILLDVAAASRDALLKKLKLYRLRAKVEIAPRDQLGVYAGLQGHPDNRPTPYADRAITFADPRHAGLPRRSIGAIQEMPANLPGSEAYHALRLQLGVPEGGDFGFEKIFALDGGLDELHAISFEKGCYVGQELTARMKHRATSRKRPLLVTTTGDLPPPGTAVTQDSDIGEIIAAHGTRGFASVRLDKWDAARGAQAADMPVTLTKPAWL
jgi:folate-binding protein YgfZ